MKHIMLITLLASLFSGMAFAVETDTECPFMKESNDRSFNPKTASSSVEKPVVKKPAVIKQ